MRASTGAARRFHELDPDPRTGHEIWVHRVDRPAVIFGSTQVPGGPDGSWDMAAAPTAGSGLEVCRRRSGGGLVIVQPDDVWIDAIVPRHSPLHVDDVGRAFRWFGQVWLDALRSLLVEQNLGGRKLSLAEPRPNRSAADRAFYCFADVGHGEVLHGDRKVVGISQRRTRSWTRLQALLVTSWEPGRIDELVASALSVVGHGDRDRASLGVPPHAAAEVQAGLGAGGWPAGVARERIVQAVLGRLPGVAGDTGSDPVV